MTNKASLDQAERLFILTEEFPDGFEKYDGERVLIESGAMKGRTVLQSLCRAGFIFNTRERCGRIPGFYEITENGFLAALEFEKAIQRNAARLGYVQKD